MKFASALLALFALAIGALLLVLTLTADAKEKPELNVEEDDQADNGVGDVIPAAWLRREQKERAEAAKRDQCIAAGRVWVYFREQHCDPVADGGLPPDGGLRNCIVATCRKAKVK